MKPLPHSAYRRFVEVGGWEKKGTAHGSGKTGDHYRYNLRLTTGDVLTTRVSHGSGQINDPKLIAAIHRDQVGVTKEDFWRCVDNGVLPPRPKPPSALTEGDPLEAKLVRNLIRRVGLTEAEIATFTKAEAVARWEQYLSEGGS